MVVPWFLKSVPRLTWWKIQAELDQEILRSTLLNFQELAIMLDSYELLVANDTLPTESDACLQQNPELVLFLVISLSLCP